MRKKTFALSLAVFAVLQAGASAAAVNCDRVNRELKLGRWPADVALDMGATLAQVNSCKDNPPATAPRTTPPAKAPEAKRSGSHVEKTSGR